MLHIPPEGTAPLSELTVHDRNGSRLVQLPFCCVQGFPTVKLLLHNEINRSAETQACIPPGSATSQGGNPCDYIQLNTEKTISI